MFLIFFIILIFPVNFKAETFPKIFGCFCEGGVITGNLENGSKLKIEKRGEKLNIRGSLPSKNDMNIFKVQRISLGLKADLIGLEEAKKKLQLLNN